MSATSFRREWVGFTAMSIGLFMAILDIQIVAAALPRIAQALHTPLDALSWVQTAYLITEVIGIAMAGRLARALSTRWLFGLSALAFTATSLGCALSHDFISLIVWRALQGFAAGTITPSVFAAGYKMFPKRLHQRAILVAGAVVMLAPTIGPFMGGYIAERLTWNWIFFINLPVGLAVAAAVIALVRIDTPDRASWRTLDLVSFLALSISLAGLEILLKLAPAEHWAAPRDYLLIVLILSCGVFFVRRCLAAHEPLVGLSPFRQTGFAAASAQNFVLGAALYGSLYVLPLFLGFVRYHTPLQIGVIMTVMGVAQLASAPFATLADKKLPARWVAFVGFALFSAGALSNAFQDPRTDFAGLIWPQILRGASLLFCILPITNVALDELPLEALSNASSVLNFMRNIGGAVGIGLVDTIVNVRPSAIATQLLDQLVHGDAKTAAFVGVPVDLLKGVNVAHADPADLTFVRPIIERAAATVAFNEAWVLLGVMLLLSLLIVPFLKRSRPILQTTPERLAHD